MAEKTLAPKIMGILNVTPDSFSDGGRFVDEGKAAARALQMIQEGADIVDIGGESSGPGSINVSLEEELSRVIPVIKKITSYQLPITDCLISVDTYKAEVARQAVASGANMINDVTALRGDPEMARAIAEAGVPVVLMYSKDKTARTTRTAKQYRDVMKTIADFFERRIAVALRAGIKRRQIILDPGMGAFISTEPKYSYEILKRLGELKKFKLPILVGTSKKSFLGGSISDRALPTLMTNAIAAQNGADIIRVHDVKEHREMLAMLLP